MKKLLAVLLVFCGNQIQAAAQEKGILVKNETGLLIEFVDSKRLKLEILKANQSKNLTNINDIYEIRALQRLNPNTGIPVPVIRKLVLPSEEEIAKLQSGKYYLGIKYSRPDLNYEILPLENQPEQKMAGAIPGGISPESMEAVIQLRTQLETAQSELTSAKNRKAQLEANLADEQKRIKALESKVQALQQKLQQGS